MPVKKKEFEDELTVINVSLRGNTVILNLRFTKPQVEDTSKLRPENIVEPLSQSEAERVARQVARGTMQALQKQMQQQMRVRFMPPTSPFDAIQIVLSKQEYLEIGRPTVDDKLTLKLRMK